MKKDSLDVKHVIHVALVLLIISAVAAALLGFTNSITKAKIAQQEKQTNIEARQKVLKKADKFTEIKNIKAVAKKAAKSNSGIVNEAYKGYKNGQLVGYTVKVSPKGYGGEVELLFGYDTSGKTTGITVISNSETAGLGARCVEPSFQKQFYGLSANNTYTVAKHGSKSSPTQIEALAGATITSRAVTLGLNTSDQVYKVISKGAK
ncbi:RnfABCDGE type electron transport complex subunit G [Pseudoramibacter sp.]|jgi:electron transport complex protein RnfG|uniref:RnfABCDGE type electron transport complex subunit G n=1 Tax=Pseudoramibacter sp. TaxID=2034862 RepID=UPI0025FBF2FB|nr:RnfABCDGE type electron transport complex subunit G [Pseudoramibacter sp.]MCH4073009.1 RnfABCDGE type electron transport complex subunit G [Pseudoramibacter sp.]MCH4106780.1 RnfABCDGE type electron transport complex subunit G [Pseudoramibacter sp.]